MRSCITGGRRGKACGFGPCTARSGDVGSAGDCEDALCAPANFRADDPAYGEEGISSVCRRQALHARLLGFTHPGTRAWVEYAAPLPADLTLLRQTLAARESGHERLEL